MATVGLIVISSFYKENDGDIKWMKDFGCQRIIEENIEERIPHLPKWENLLDELSFNDTLVIPKFSRLLLSLNKLVCLLELIKLKNIRIISIHDKIDSSGELFPDVKTQDFLNFLCSLPKETWAINKMREILDKGTTIYKKPCNPLKRNKEETQHKVVRMYQEGRSISDILKATGYKSKSSIFRILENYGIKPNRCKGDHFPEDASRTP